MTSIWKGNITKIWDAIQFCRIVDNLFFWAQHCLKPMVTQYLSQWRQRYCPDVPRIHSLLEKYTKTAEMVHQIQDHLSFLGLSPNEDLPALVRQAVVFQGVMRSSNNELKAVSTAKEESKVPKGISLPSRPKENSSSAPLSSSTEPRQEIDAKFRLKGKEILRENSDLSAGDKEEGTAESSHTNDTPNLPLKPPPKHQTPVLILPNNGKETAVDSSTVREDKKGEHFIIFLLPCNRHLLTLFLDISTNVLTNEPAMSSKSSAFSAAEWTEPFFVQGQIKPSSFEERYSPLPGQPKGGDDARLNLVQKTLRSMASRVENGHVLSLERQKRRKVDRLLEENRAHNMESRSKLLARKDSEKERSTDRLSSPPNPFVSENFELSFEITPRLNLDMTIPTQLITHRHGPYPTLRIWAVEHTDFPRSTRSCVRMRMMDGEGDPTIVEPLHTPPGSQFRVRIPWRGKNIIVQLPPVPPASVSVHGTSDSTKS
jgi:hypothetical protein